MRKLSAKWVPKCLKADQKRQRCQSSEQLLEFFRRGPNDFLSQLVTMDETWLYHYDQETKQQPMEWRHSGSPCPKKFRVQKPAGRALASIFFWYQDGILHIIFQRAKLSTRSIIHHCWCNWRTFEGKTPAAGRSSMWSFSWHDNAPTHRALATQKKVAYLGFRCLDHSPYSSDLAPSDYHLFPRLKKKKGNVAIFLPTRKSLLPRRSAWTDNLLNFLWVACKSRATG